MIDFSQARRTMIDSQLRTFDVNDLPLLDAMDEVAREGFVLPARQSLAYSDLELPVSEGAHPRVMLAPMILARMIQALEVSAGSKVLDVACGRGYSSAVLAALGASVTAIEDDEALCTSAKHCLAATGVSNIAIKCGNLGEGWPDNAPFDAILINGSLEIRPEKLLNQLVEGGRLACVMGRGRSGRATLFVKAGSSFGERSLFDAAAPALAAFQAKPTFSF